MQLIKKIVNKTLKLFDLQLSNVKNNFIFPIGTEKEIIRFINTSNQFSMTGYHRMYILSEAIKYMVMTHLRA